MKDKTRKNEESLIRLFSTCKPFSEHLMKWEDPLLPDKYDQNFFEYSGQPTTEEFAKALAYQKRIGAGFIKLEGDEPLADSFGLEAAVTLTMVLREDAAQWQTNPNVTFRTPALSELEALELRHFGALYGDDFTRRNICRSYEKLTYCGAYLDGALAGACYCFCENGITCIDGLIVDEACRHRRVATSLMQHIRDRYAGTTVFLHADADDTPKQMYKKMGFETVDYLYEYLSTDIENNSRRENMMHNVTIRLEKEEEYRDVEALVREAFWNVYRPGCSEHYVLHVLRDDPAFVGELDFVMELDGTLIGQNMFMKTVIEADDGRAIPVLTMGPICITPALKRKGYGKILLDYSLQKAAALGFGAVLFEGNIDFYSKCGFTYARRFGIRYHDLPEGADDSFFLCKELIPGYLDDVTGVYQTPQGYYVEDAAVEKFDKDFPPKQKLKLPGQLFD